MNIREWPTRVLAVSRLMPAEYNPRTISAENLAALQESLERFGLVQEIVWNRRTGTVVAGHQRLKILANAGVRKCRCVVVDLPADEERALNVALNSPELAGTFDQDKLAVVLKDLKRGEALRFDRLLKSLGEEAAAPRELPPPPPPPKLIWAIVAIPVADWPRATNLVEALAKIPGAICETTYE